MQISRTPIPPLPTEDLAHVLKHTHELWEELRAGTIFITGGTGFFGMWLLETFAHANEVLGLSARTVVLTRNPAAFAAKAPHLAGRHDLEFAEGDVRNFAFPAGEFPFVIHAGTTSSAPVEPLEMFATIVDGTRRVLEFAAERGTRKLLFVSSGAVYGRQPPELTHVPEEYRGAPDPLEPGSAYGEGKRAAEFLCCLAGQKHGFETKIARCFAFVGPHLPLDAHFAIGNFIRDAIQGGPIRVGGRRHPLPLLPLRRGPRHLVVVLALPRREWPRLQSRFRSGAAGYRTECSWFGFLILVRPCAHFSNSELARHLDSRKIGNRMFFGGNLLRQPAFVQLKKDRPDFFRVIGDLPGADRIMNQAMFLGTYPGLTRAMLDYKIQTIHRFSRGGTS